MIKLHSFRGKRYRIVACPSDSGGVCDTPKGNDKEMVVPVDGETLHDLQSTIHEGIHACLWDLDEEAVQEMGDDIGRLLWRLGWRK